MDASERLMYETIERDAAEYEQKLEKWSKEAVEAVRQMYGNLVERTSVIRDEGYAETKDPEDRKLLDQIRSEAIKELDAEINLIIGTIEKRFQTSKFANHNRKVRRIRWLRNKHIGGQDERH